MRSPARWIGAGAIALPIALALSPLGASDAAASHPPQSRYVGAQTCRNCHSAGDKGDQFGIWKESLHARAWETLATPEAKAIAAERGIDDPQKSDECIRCHVTAFGVDDELIRKGFDRTLGVQCETCHGPGEEHFRARFAAAARGEIDPAEYQPVPEGEIVVRPGFDTCVQCHNRESPTFEPFCFVERRAEILHLDPRKPRTPEEIEELKCPCGDDCECEQAECGGYVGAEEEDDVEPDEPETEEEESEQEEG